LHYFFGFIGFAQPLGSKTVGFDFRDLAIQWFRPKEADSIPNVLQKW
jgi:hypothetical protein